MEVYLGRKQKLWTAKLKYENLTNTVFVCYMLIKEYKPEVELRKSVKSAKGLTFVMHRTAAHWAEPLMSD